MRFGILLGAVILLGAFIFWRDLYGSVKGKQTAKDTKEKETVGQNANGISILRQWDLPGDLKEVSGIAYMDDNRFACIQDEEGTIFIYNRSTNKIENRISFAGPGDYEDIAIQGQTAYVVRADGRLFQVDLDKGEDSMKEYATGLTKDHNVEGLVFDAANNRLLMAIKDEEPGNKDYKGIYAFDINSKKFIDEPLVKISMDETGLNDAGKKKNKSVKPSAVGIHPQTREIYVTDGPKSRLLIMDSLGKILRMLELGKKFSQPEGISFSPAGDLFISNEGTSNPGNIMEVKVNR